MQKNGGGEETSISFNINFRLGDMRCIANSIEEFTELTYGVEGYELTSFEGIIRIKEKKIFFHYIFDFSVSAENKVDLERFLNILERTSLDEKEGLQRSYIEAQTNIEHQNNVTIVQGKNNTVISNNSNINTSELKKESKVKKWFVAIAQNLVSNWIWYLLTIIASALILYFS